MRPEGLDRVEKSFTDYEIWFPPEGSLVLCDGEGHPSLFEIEGQQFMFCYSAERTDEEIYEDLRTIRRAGFPGPYNLFRADLSPAVAEGAGDEFHLLLDAPLSNVHHLVGITIEQVA